jgi:transcriptional regulator with XRE-family HTH domain
VGERLRTLRLARQETLREVAGAAGVTEGYLSHLEVGTRSGVSNAVANALAAHFGTSAKWILTGEEEDPISLATEEYYRAIEDSGLREEAAELSHQIAVLLDYFISADDSGRRLALPRIAHMVERFAAECSARNGAIREAGMKLARANFGAASQVILDFRDTLEDTSNMPDLWPLLLERVKECLKTARQIDLAKHLGVSKQAVNQYLHGTSVPSIEKGLRLLEWVKAEEAKKSGPEGGGTPSEPRTQKRKSDEKPSSGPP